MLYSGTDPESYITEYTLLYEDKSPPQPLGLYLHRGFVAHGFVFDGRCDAHLQPPASFKNNHFTEMCAVVPRRARI